MAGKADRGNAEAARDATVDIDDVDMYGGAGHMGLDDVELAEGGAPAKVRAYRISGALCLTGACALRLCLEYTLAGY